MAEIAKLRICFENAFDFGDGDSSLQNILRGTYKTLSGSGETLLDSGDFASDVSIDFFALFRHDITASGKWRVKLYDAIGSGGNLVYDSGLVDAWCFQGANDFLFWDRFHSVMYFTKVTARSYEIYIDDGTRSIEVGRVWCGESLRPYYNCSYGISLKWAESSTQIETAGGSLITETKGKWRELSFNLSFTTQADNENLATFFNSVGKRRDIFVSLFPENANLTERDYTLDGKIIGDGPTQVNDFYLNWANSIKLREI